MTRSLDAFIGGMIGKVLGLACLLQVCAFTAQAQFQIPNYASNGVSYYIAGGTALVIDCDSTNSGDLIIPGTVMGVPVTGIDTWAFRGPANLSSITLPDSVTAVNSQAFISSRATNIFLGEGLLSIGGAAFQDCSNLGTITIPQSVTNINGDLFRFDYSLRQIQVGAGNQYYKSVDGVLFDAGQTRLIEYPCGKADASYAIPTGVNEIEPFAFEDNFHLTNITIPDTVTTIRLAAFVGCTNLTSFYLPASVTNLEAEFVGGCYHLPAVNVALDNPCFCSLNGVLYDRNRTNLIYYPEGSTATSYVVPNTVTSISVALGFVRNLTALYFRGDAPAAGMQYLTNNPTAVYYLPGTSGWGSTFGGDSAFGSGIAYGAVNTALWNLSNPTILDGGANFGVRNHQLSFTVSWATNATVVVEACTNLSNPVWQPLQTNAITTGSFQFTDPQWTNHPGRFYRVRTQ